MKKSSAPATSGHESVAPLTKNQPTTKRKAFTVKTVEHLPEGGQPDPLRPGLILRVGLDRRSWAVRYRKAGKRHFDRIGFFPTLGLAAARERAAEILKRVETGAPALAEPPV